MVSGGVVCGLIAAAGCIGGYFIAHSVVSYFRNIGVGDGDVKSHSSLISCKFVFQLRSALGKSGPVAL